MTPEIRQVIKINLWIVAGLASAYAVLSPLFGGPMPSVPIHHVLHGVMMVVGALWGRYMVVRRGRRTDAGHGQAWLILTTSVIMVVATVSMISVTSTFFMTHPLYHALDHAAIFALGWFGGYAAEKYDEKAGIVWAVLAGIMSLIAATGLGWRP